MSTRTRRLGNQDVQSSNDGQGSSASTSQLPTDSNIISLVRPSTQAQPQTPGQPQGQRKRRLDVDPDNIIATEASNGRLKRRRSPSAPLLDHPTGSGPGSSISLETEMAKREDAKTKGREIYDAVMYAQETESVTLRSSCNVQGTLRLKSSAIVVGNIVDVSWHRPSSHFPTDVNFRIITNSSSTRCHWP
jgi:hypothetical protein